MQKKKNCFYIGRLFFFQILKVQPPDFEAGFFQKVVNINKNFKG